MRTATFAVFLLSVALPSIASTLNDRDNTHFQSSFNRRTVGGGGSDDLASMLATRDTYAALTTRDAHMNVNDKRFFWSLIPAAISGITSLVKGRKGKRDVDQASAIGLYDNAGTLLQVIEPGQALQARDIGLEHLHGNDKRFFWSLIPTLIGGITSLAKGRKGKRDNTIDFSDAADVADFVDAYNQAAGLSRRQDATPGGNMNMGLFADNGKLITVVPHGQAPVAAPKVAARNAGDRYGLYSDDGKLLQVVNPKQQKRSLDEAAIEEALLEEAMLEEAAAEEAGFEEAGFEEAGFEEADADQAGFEEAGFEEADADQAAADEAALEEAALEEAALEEAALEEAAAEEAAAEEAEFEKRDVQARVVGPRSAPLGWFSRA